MGNDSQTAVIKILYDVPRNEAGKLFLIGKLLASRGINENSSDRLMSAGAVFMMWEMFTY